MPATIPVARNSISVKLPSLRTFVSPLGLYQDHKANNDHPQDNGPEGDHIHRRHTDHGKLTVHGKGTHSSTDFPPRESRFHNKLPKSLLTPTQCIEFLGFVTNSVAMEIKMPGEKIKQIRLESKKLQNLQLPGTSPGTPARQAQSCHSCNSTSPPVLQEPTTMPAKSTGGKGRERLHSHCPPDTSSHGGAHMVATTPYQVEWAVSTFTDPRHDNRNRYFHHRSGSLLPGGKNWGAMVTDREHETHQLSGTISSHVCSEVLCQRQRKYPDPFKIGQHNSPHLHQQIWRDYL